MTLHVEVVKQLVCKAGFSRKIVEVVALDLKRYKAFVPTEYLPAE